TGFWDIEDLSHYLKVKVKTLYAMTSDIPHYRVGRLIRFRKEEIDSWMEDKKVNTSKGTSTPGRVKNNILIDPLIRKVIDRRRENVYNLDRGKSDRIKGPRKEKDNGSI
ncbi:MAG: helix-turn-helix domain-containing protein, partial [Deltaproteobacteria bacterium]|nr:helix-turn-helix domain-containing protein [Deltaproteobacteria bacterium]